MTSGELGREAQDVRKQGFVTRYKEYLGQAMEMRRNELPESMKFKLGDLGKGVGVEFLKEILGPFGLAIDIIEFPWKIGDFIKEFRYNRKLRGLQKQYGF